MSISRQLMRTGLFAPALVAAMVVSGGASAAGKAQYASNIAVEYKVTISGLEVGRMKIAYAIDAERYSITGSGGSSSIVRAFYKINASSQSGGRITPQGPQPANFSLSYRIKRKSGDISMQFDRKKAIKTLVVNPAKKPKPHYVPVKAVHKQDVLDPMSALLLASKSARAQANKTACDATVAIFDGKSRFNVVLSYKGRRRIRAKRKGAYQGPVAICKAKYRPLAGYNPKSRNTRRVMAMEGIEAWLIPVPNSRFFVPYLVRYPSKLGPVVIYARKYRLAQNRIAKPQLASQ